MLAADKRTVEAVAMESVSVSGSFIMSRFFFVIAAVDRGVEVVVSMDGDVYIFLSPAALIIPVEVELDEDDV